MRKLLLLLLVIVAAVLVGGPYYTGKVAEKEFKNFADQVGQRSQQKIRIENYKRGWFTSTADVVIQVSPPANRRPAGMPFKGLTFTMHEVIKHGPVIIDQHGLHFALAVAHGHLQFDPLVQFFLEQVFTDKDQQPKVLSTITFNYDKSVRTTTEIPAFKFTNQKTGITANWQGLTQSAEFNAPLTALSANLIFNGMTAERMGMKLNMAKSTLHVKQQAGADNVWFGTVKMDVPSITAQMGNRKLFDLQAMNFNQDTNIEDHLLRGLLEYNLQSVQVMGKNYGPFKIALNLQNLDTKALGQLMSKQPEFRDMASMSPKQLQVFRGELAKLVAQLFGRGFEMNIQQFLLTFPEGAVTATGKMTVADQAGKQVSLEQLAQLLHANVKLQMPETLARSMLLHKNMRNLQRQQWALKRLQMKLQKLNGGKPLTPELQQKHQELMQRFKPMSRAQMQQTAQQATDEQFEQWFKDGAFEKVGNNLVLKLVLKDGKVLINDKPADSVLKPKIATMPTQRLQPVQQQNGATQTGHDGANNSGVTEPNHQQQNHSQPAASQEAQ